MKRIKHPNNPNKTKFVGQHNLLYKEKLLVTKGYSIYNNGMLYFIFGALEFSVDLTSDEARKNLFFNEWSLPTIPEGSVRCKNKTLFFETNIVNFRISRWKIVGLIKGHIQSLEILNFNYIGGENE